MTTLEQQIAHFRNYWNVPQEDIDKLIELAIKDNNVKQAAKKEKFLYEAISRMKATNVHSEEANWGKPEGKEVW